MEWNDERIATLTKLWREGLSAAQVARQLGGVSRSAVIGKVHRLGIAGRDAPSRPAGQGVGSVARASAGGVRGTPSARAPTAARSPSSRVVFEVAATATIHTLAASACRWPIGDPGDANFGFCGRIRAGSGFYCGGHAAMAVRRREPMKPNEIDRLVNRFVEGAAHARQPADVSWREVA